MHPANVVKVTLPFLFLLSLAGALAMEPELSAPLWFWHGLCMTIAILLLMIPGILVRQIKGKLNTKIHGILSFLSLLVQILGFSLIYRSKENRNKSHFTSVHGQLGVSVLLINAVFTVISFVWFEPDYRLFQPNWYMKMSHKWGGRLLACFFLYVMWLGYITRLPASISQWSLGVSFAVIGVITIRNGLKQIFGEKSTTKIA
jgi:cytochrome b561